MQPTDEVYLVIMVIAVGLIVFGAAISAISMLMWFGIILAVVFAVAWLVSRLKRRGTDY